MIRNKSVTAIVLVAGNSTRYGQNRNKNFEKIDEKSVLTFSLKKFDQNKYIDNIVIAVKKDEKEKVEAMVNEYKLSHKVELVIGGNTRQESVYNCIKTVDSDIVIIHDGARPAIKDEYIINCIENMEKYKGVTIGVKSKDTIKITDDNGVVIDTTKRSNTWLVQTPQCFDRRLLLEVHEKYKNTEVTDDCALLEKDGYQIKMIEGDYTNIKITTYEDLGVIRGFLSEK
jgi:2-C-methyl-D-erythritol 4-phosphate cytidylyltransferase